MEISVWATTVEEDSERNVENVSERNVENVSVIIYDFMCELKWKLLWIKYPLATSFVSPDP